MWPVAAHESDVSLSVTPFADPVQEAKGIAGIHLDAIRAAVDEFAIYVTTLAVAGWVSANTYGDNSFWGDLPRPFGRRSRWRPRSCQGFWSDSSVIVASWVPSISV